MVVSGVKRKREAEHIQCDVENLANFYQETKMQAKISEVK